jgi:iron complex outermembrane recepter protein
MAAVLLLLAAALAAEPVARAGESRCEARARVLFGRSRLVVPADPSTGTSPPTVSRRVPFVFPDRWPPACKSSSLLHEILVGPDGAVRELFTLGSPCAEFDRVVRRSLRRWSYEPPRRGNEPVAVCVAVSTLVDPR